ncbi:hypothetical protein ES707_01058 [subsurface metagenome]
MIKINLLPKEIEKKVALREKKILLSMIVLLVVGGFLGLYFLKVGQYTRLKKKVKRVEKELNLLETIVKKVDEIEKSKEALAKKLDVIQSLLGNRVVYPQLFEDLARIVSSRVWLNSLTTKSESDFLTITIEASAIDNYAIANFITKLSEDKNFSKVELSNIATRKGKEEIAIKNFGVTCKYR